MQNALHAHLHQVLVLGEDGRLPVPGLVRRLGRHPVDTVGQEEVDPALPVLSVEDLQTKALAFINYYNDTMTKPFKWRYQGKALLV